MLIERPNKDTPRPLVIASVEARIVQRAILEVLQELPGIKGRVLAPTSFGAIKERGVPMAVTYAYMAAEKGAAYYIRSDIDAFFRNIPRAYVVDRVRLAAGVTDKVFLRLLSEATSVELDNLDALGKWGDLFPTYELGVAQGCALSPLLGNVLLADFDREMNAGSSLTLRYVDDFIILAQNEKDAWRAFRKAGALLRRLGLRAYDPRTEVSKASHGDTARGFEFLGCEVTPGFLRPTGKARGKLLDRIDAKLDESRRAMREPSVLFQRKLSVAQTLSWLGEVVRAWGNQYSFCNGDQWFEELDRRIEKRILAYLADCRKLASRTPIVDRALLLRRLVGIPLVAKRKRKDVQYDRAALDALLDRAGFLA